jgi:hypothetical protein
MFLRVSPCVQALPPVILSCPRGLSQGEVSAHLLSPVRAKLRRGSVKRSTALGGRHVGTSQRGCAAGRLGKVDHGAALGGRQGGVRPTPGPRRPVLRA